MDVKKRIAFAILVLFILASPCQTIDPLAVVHVLDGDTLQLLNGERVRLLGIDAPESINNAKLYLDAKRTGQEDKEIIEMGKKATEFTRKLVEGRRIRLEYDVQKKDKYGRRRAYVYIFRCGPACMDEAEGSRELEFVRNENGLFIFLNATLVKAGYAKVMIIPPNVKYQELFVRLEKEAREQKRGLWA